MSVATKIAHTMGLDDTILISARSYRSVSLDMNRIVYLSAIVSTHLYHNRNLVVTIVLQSNKRWSLCDLITSLNVKGPPSSLGLSSLATNPPREVDVLWHDGYPLGVDGAEVGVLKQSDKIGLSSLLESQDSGRLESKVVLELRGDLANESLEGKLADQKFSALLKLPDLAERHSSGAVAVRLLHTTRNRCALSGSLGGQLLPRNLSSGGLPCSLLSSSHDLTE